MADLAEMKACMERIRAQQAATAGDARAQAADAEGDLIAELDGLLVPA